MSVCAVCGSADFGDPRDGLFFCLECGTQSQDVRVEVSQIEDGSGFTRTLKRKKGKSKKKDGLESSDSDCHALEMFQRIMKRQCDALIELGFDPSVKEAARLIWFIYLRHYGYAFRDQSQAARPSNSDDSSEKDLQAGHSQSPGSSSSKSTHTLNGSGPSVSGRSSRKRCSSSTAPNSAKRVKTETDAGYNTFPDDKFLFKEDEDVGEASQGTVKIDASKSVQIMEGISSWEQLEEVERTMDCKQLLMFRQAYLSSHSSKPKFVGKGERWASQPRVFTQFMTVSVLYLALLYTEQPVLPVDIVRWVRLEKIPLNTALGKGARFRNQDNFFTTTLVTTAGVIDQAFKLYHNLPLPPMPSPDPHALSHIIISRLHLTECFQRLVDRALDTVYLPVGFTHRCRMDSECAAVIIIMLKILYGLDDHMEMDSSAYTDAVSVTRPIKEEATEDDPCVKLTTANSLFVWVDWVQMYCTHVSKIPEEEIPFDSQELRKMKNYQSYFQFCRETVFTKCRPVPARGRSYRELDPIFSKKIAEIFSSASQSSNYKPTTSHLSSVQQPTPPPPLTPSPVTSDVPRLVHLSHFLRNPKAPCTTYRPLPTSPGFRQDLDENQLSHAMRFILSVICQLIDVPLRSMYTVLLSVEKAFTKGVVVILKNLAHDFL